MKSSLMITFGEVPTLKACNPGCMHRGDFRLSTDRPIGDFLFDVHFVDLENFQPLARFKVQKFAEVTKFVLGFKCDSFAPQTAGGECFYRLNK